MVYIPIFIAILGFTIVVDFFAANSIESATGKKKKRLLALSIIINLGTLFIFKYYNFFNQNITGLLNEVGFTNPIPFLKIALPIGLSFHTFQAMSYTIEVYRGNQRAERHLGIYALYVMFYPQLVAGPIERPQHLLHQFREKKDFDYNNVTDGLKLMAWGLFKKAVIADRLAIAVDTVYEHPEKFNSFSLILICIFFSFQIYCDFSGYSDMAIGTAKVMGFKLMNNFKNPFQSINIKEFWKRWHISLSSWFRDYLYLPLGGNKVTIPRMYLNLMIVFLISGFWHGASWNFVIWGALHGIGLIIYDATFNLRNKICPTFRFGFSSFFSLICTFFFVSFTFIFFRSENLNASMLFIQRIISDFPGCLKMMWDLHLPIENIGLSKFDWLLSFGLIALLQCIELFDSKKNIQNYLRQKPTIYRWIAYCLLVISILFLGKFNNREFIYFQF